MASKKTDQTSIRSASSDKRAMSDNNFVAVSTVICFLVLLFAAIVIKGQVSKFRFNQKVLGKQGVANKQLQKNLDAIPRLQEDYDGLGPQKQVILDSLPIKPDFPVLLSALEVMSARSGAKLTAVSPTGAADQTGASGFTASGGTASAGGPSGAKPLSFNVALSANYAQLNSFLQNLEVSSRPIRVTNVNISGVTNSLTVTLSATTYYMDEYDLQPKYEVIK